MFSSSLFKKIFIFILVSYICLFACSYLLTVSHIKQTVFALISLLMLSLFAVISCFFIDRMLSPVKKLHLTAKKVMDGNLSVRCDVDRKDELGMLAEAFNNMADNLSTNILELDNRVKVRTYELIAAKEAAESATRYKSEFLANMSHEIRTPLNAIVGLAHLAADTELSSKQMDYVNKIETAGRCLSALINDILDFSKIEAGKIEIVSSEFSIDDVFRNLSTLFTIKTEEKGLLLVFKTAENIPRLLMGDPFYLTQVLVNLISNAIKFTEKGSVTISVEKDVGDEGSETDIYSGDLDKINLTFSVADTGIGIPKTGVELLFQPFTQLDGSITRKFGGTGLGLSICRKLVGLMGGGYLGKKRRILRMHILFYGRFRYEKGNDGIGYKPSGPA